MWNPSCTNILTRKFNVVTKFTSKHFQKKSARLWCEGYQRYLSHSGKACLKASSCCCTFLGPIRPGYVHLPLARYSQAGSTLPPGDSDGKQKDPWDAERRETEALLAELIKRGRESTENTHIDPDRAMREYLLEQSDLVGLKKYRKRSSTPHTQINYGYRKKDLEKKAVEKWGSKENLNKERRKWAKKNDRQIPFYLVEEEFKKPKKKVKNSLLKDLYGSSSDAVVNFAIIVNGLNFVLKCYAWYVTKSPSIFSEAIHSFADTLNQILLKYGLYNSRKKADTVHPYGYVNMKHVSSLISGVIIFSVGTGMSVYHGIHTMMFPEPAGSMYWAIALLFGSLLSEGASLAIALYSLMEKAKEKDLSLMMYFQRALDPNVTVVVLEDLVAVVGVAIAMIFMSLTHFTGNPVYDSIGSIIIGGLLGIVARFIIQTNTSILIGKSIPEIEKLYIRLFLENDRMIRSVHDIKAIEMGGEVRFKAEIDFDGRELAQLYLNLLDKEALLKRVNGISSTEELDELYLSIGEKVVDLMGQQIDRIEFELKQEFKQKYDMTIRHVDLEPL